jgi:hypothetical protein
MPIIGRESLEPCRDRGAGGSHATQPAPPRRWSGSALAGLCAGRAAGGDFLVHDQLQGQASRLQVGMVLPAPHDRADGAVACRHDALRQELEQRAAHPEPWESRP